MLLLILELDLLTMLGSQANVYAYLELVRAIGLTDFAALLTTWRSRGERAFNLSPGRVVPRANLVYYSPH